MESAKRKIIETFLHEGKDRHETRRAFISEGLSTKNFTEEYDSMLKELGVKEPKQAMPTMFATGEVPLRRKPRRNYATLVLERILKIVLLVIVLAACVYFGIKFLVPPVLEALKESEYTGSELNISDTVLLAKMESTVASAHLYGRRMASYEGLCSDISVVDPIKCYETPTSYVFFAPVSSGFYCIDDSGYKGYMDTPPATQSACVQ